MLIVLFIPRTGSAYPVSACEAVPSVLAQPDGQMPTPVNMLDEHARTNGRTPQSSTLVNMQIVATYLTRPVSAEEFLRPPSENELSSLAETMNNRHKGCKVSWRMKGHAESDGKHEVLPSRIRALWNQDNREALRKSLLLARALGADVPVFTNEQAFKPLYLAFRVTSARALDALFTDPKHSATADKLRAVGEVLDSAFGDAAVKEKQIAYLQAIRDPNGNFDTKTDAENALKDELRKYIGTGLKRRAELAFTQDEIEKILKAAI